MSAPRTTARFESTLVALPVDNVDTDQIIPARFLKVTTRTGLGRHLFADWRYGPAGAPEPEFPLNRPERRHAAILVAGDNFGCGSSREHAAWALADHGFRAVVSTSFADIFRSNALKNGLLPIQVDAAAHARLLALAEASPAARVSVDLATRTLTFPGDGDDHVVVFPIEPFARHCLMHGIDELGYLLAAAPDVDAYEGSNPARVDTLDRGGSA